MGSQTVTDLPRYHSLVEDFTCLADRWMAAGQLRGPANVGGGYFLDLTIPLSGEEGDVLPEARPLRQFLETGRPL